ncbi:tRNA (guanosine(46)-N7)-methyltransferase TrmB [Rapidithrix thailandica]|uniref:tRNA (guanine-N(7)-)-methyltransferase n=1 Tax=Rapidithrix thailandica TaxID=413964 RepID=A0AAW9SE53_9BACT
MSRRKLKKFAQNEERKNILEPGKPLYQNLKGNWNELIFKNSNEIVLELACGRGEYSTGLAEKFPDKNFIGIDLKGDRLWYGSNVALEKQLDNVAFLRCQIQHLNYFFEKHEVAEIWIVFPDPRPKKGDAKRRLTHPRFLKIYHEILKPGGWVNFKTDNKQLFEYSVETLETLELTLEALTRDLYNSPFLEEHYGITTRYERKFSAQGLTINYLKFKYKEGFSADHLLDKSFVEMYSPFEGKLSREMEC